MPFLTLNHSSLRKLLHTQVLLFIGALIFFIGLTHSPVPSAKAAIPTDIGEGLLTYCRDQAKQAKNACDDENFAGSGETLINAAINVASFHCENTGTAKKETECIEEKVKDYIKKAAQEDHSSAAKFKSALHEVLQDAGGSLRKASAESILGGGGCAGAKRSRSCNSGMQPR